MFSALLLAAAVAASAPDFDHPDAYTGEDGCRYVRKRAPKAPPRRLIVVQYLRPPSPPASAASAPPRPAVGKKKPARKPPAREEVPGYDREDCDDARPPTPLEVMLPPPLPFSPAPDEPLPPDLPADLESPLPAPLLVPDLPPPEGVAGGNPPFWFPAGPAPGPILLVIEPAIPAIPEPATFYLLIVGFCALFWVRRR